MKKNIVTFAFLVCVYGTTYSQCVSTCNGSNTSLGNSAGDALTTGFRNTFLGYFSGTNTDVGFENTFVGYFAGLDNTGGVSNTFIGRSAGQSSSTGSFNVMMGHSAGLDNLTGGSNTFIGSSAGLQNTTGSSNTYLGRFAGQSNLTGSGNVFLGNQSGANETGSNKLYIDNSNTSSPLIYGDFEQNVVNVNGALGIGIENPERPIHLRATDAIFRIDRDRADPGFAIVRFDEGFNNVWKSFYFYTKATAENDGKFIIADWGTNVSGSSTLRLVVGNDGNVGIGDFAFVNPSQKLTVNGNVLATGSYVASDKRFKTDVTSITNAMTRLSELEGVSYGYNLKKFAQKGFSDKKTLGLIAQDVEKVFPELVIEDAEGYKAVNYIGLIPVLIEALKTQQTEINTLKEALKSTKTSIADIPAKLYQNQPNPFDRTTEIRVYLPESAEQATLYIYDMQGTQIKQVIVDQRGETAIELQGNSLKAGMYLYALIVDGEEVDTKRMILTK